METIEKPLLRRILSWLLAAVLLVTLAASALPVSAAKSNDTVELAIQGVCDYKIAYQVLDKVNAERKKAGQKALVMDTVLLDAAMQRAAECAVYYSHTRPNGETCYTVLDEEYLHFSTGENIAAGYKSATDVMNGWMNSPGHKSNILRSEFQAAGIGVFKVDGIYYWAQVFHAHKNKTDKTEKQPVTKTVSFEARTDLLDLSINHKKLSLESGETATLQITNCNLGFPYYDYLLSPPGFTYSFTTDGIVTISDKGAVTPVGHGTTTIKVWGKNHTSKQPLFSVEVTAECDQLTASAAVGDGEIKVSWNRVTGATSYNVYKSVYQNGAWSEYTRISHNTSKSFSCKDTDLVPGVEVKYCVYACEDIRGQKEMDIHDTVTTMYLAQPSVKVANTASGIKVSWGKVTGATTYKVYRSEYKSGKWAAYKAYKTTKTASWTDTKAQSGQKIRYTVYAYNGSYKSAEKDGVAITRLAQPTVKLANASKGVKISWGKVDGATSYKVYKSEYKNGAWTSYKALKTALSPSATSYTDTSAKSGQKVRYTVYAVNGGDISAEKDGVAITRLAQPTVKLANAASGVKVSWGKVTGATSYKVYRSEYKNGKWSSYKAYKTTKAVSWTDTKVKSGQKVRYTVYAYKGNDKSAEKTGVAITHLSQPKVKLTKATKGVKVSWGKVTGATTYKVYKSVYKNGKWSTYKVYKTTKSVSCTDTSVKSKQKVRYTVYAVSGSDKSAEKTGVSITR